MLTNKEKQTLEIIKAFIENEGYSPTFEQIADKLGVKAKSTVSHYVRALKEKNYIHIPEGKRKCIELIEQANDYALPLVGTIAAGSPLEAYEVIESVDLGGLISTKEHDRYLLKISGESMKDIGILDGDLVLIQKQQVARDGQIVVALIDDSEATLKEFKMQNNNTVLLVAHNNAIAPMIYPADRVKIQGVYLGLRFSKNYLG
ncbi:transcriptional repressor LexA [Fangia hongkongensis]|uniref:transcriptional repressor LexA n=1 Tax=Fangia hongkongensis TaxID=270495 RepID=UPI00037CCA8B|nr:transcriptional repressor LexA [Fangia hongkongensis]MBK2124855.1 transcriptional repressor LexA [Fangia hongkongensis]